MTSRPDPVVAQHFRHLDPTVIEEETDLNEQDLRGFIETGLPEPCRRSASSGRIVERIVELAEGVFLYAHWVVRELKRGRLSAEHVDQFPQGLGAVYAGFFDRMRPGLGSRRGLDIDGPLPPFVLPAFAKAVGEPRRSVGEGGKCLGKA